MKIQILGSSVHDGARHQFVSSYLINGTVAIDAGCIGLWGTPQEQERVRHVFLTHAHIDHIASLPIFVENAWTPAETCPCIYGSYETISDVQKHIFNDRIWPDFIELSRKMPPFLDVRTVMSEQSVTADGLRITPVHVNHVIPTFGYVVSDGTTAVVFGGDSGPTERLREIAHQTSELRAVFLEACFPNSMTGLAHASLHMTPEMLLREVAKMPDGVRVIAVHIKVRYREQVIRELPALELPHLIIGQCEKEYTF